VYKGKVYYFCSDACRRAFERNPDYYLEHGPTGKDPVCSMEVPETVPYKFTYKGVTYYFCCEDCLEEFKSDPEYYVSRLQRGPHKH
jgi:Cu+-exporting ATPase